MALLDTVLVLSFVAAGAYVFVYHVLPNIPGGYLQGQPPLVSSLLPQQPAPSVSQQPTTSPKVSQLISDVKDVLQQAKTSLQSPSRGTVVKPANRYTTPSSLLERIRPPVAAPQSPIRGLSSLPSGIPQYANFPSVPVRPGPNQAFVPGLGIIDQNCRQTTVLPNCNCNCRQCAWHGPVGADRRDMQHIVPSSPGQEQAACATARAGFLTKYGPCQQITGPCQCRVAGGIKNTC